MLTRITSSSFRRLSPSLSSIRNLSNLDSKFDELNSTKPSDLNTSGLVLYSKSQAMTARVLTSVSFVNLYYWGSEIAANYLFQNSSFNGESLVTTELNVAYFGACLTFALGWFAKYYASHTIHTIVKKDNNLEISFHNVWGNESKNIQIVNPNDLSFVSESYINSVKENSDNNDEKLSSKILKSSYIPLKIKNMDGNFLMEKDGLNGANGKLLLELITKSSIQTKKDFKPDDFNNYKDQTKNKYDDWKNSINNKNNKKK